MNQKKVIERFYLDSFFEKMGLLAHIVRDGDDSGNEPDFFVKINGDEIGIEITQLFKSIGRKGSTDKRTEAQHRSCLLHVAKEYYLISDIPINVHMQSSGLFKGYDCRGVARRLSEVAGQIDEWEVSKFMVDAVNKLRVRRLPASLNGYMRWTWAQDHMGFSKVISKELIEASVNPKYKKLKAYRRSTERIILLVYADTTLNSGMVHLDECPPKIELKGFESIYLYIYPERAVRVG